ncbi:MAG: nucleotidyl transferase AbiEii/AbiGii toxin family protein [Saprospiraceae bacterium]
MKNIAASIRARLLNIAHAEGLNNQLVLTRYFHERLLFRVSRSIYAEHFCLKGGVLLYAYNQHKSRPTRDLDLLGRHLAASFENLERVFKTICEAEYEMDGVEFDPSTVTTSEINKEGDYKGIRVDLEARLGSAIQNIQIDIGFGDVVIPDPLPMLFPVLLELEAPQIYAYSMETVIAEKFHAMIERSVANSRMKDFYDVFLLLHSGNIRKLILEEAIIATFRNRGTSYYSEHSLFDIAFENDASRLTMWTAFLRKSKLPDMDFKVVMSIIRSELLPIYERLR